MVESFGTVAVVRVLCSFAGGAGHLVPQAPLHRALASAGHELTLAGRASAVAAVPRGIYSRIVERPDRRSELAEAIAPLAPVDIEHELSVIERHFAGRAALGTAAALDEELRGVDLVVCDEVDFGAIAAAQRARIPVVVVAVIASGALVRPERLTDALDALRDQLGVPEPIRPYGDFFVVPFTPSMRDPRFPAPTDALWMQPRAGSPSDSDGSIVATLGTEFNTESGDLFSRILTALSVTDRSAVVAIGCDLDPKRFGTQPPHVRVERFVDLDTVISRASLVLHHGGSGLFLRSVLGGAPQIVLPMGADQPFTADSVNRLGLGQVLDPITVTAHEIVEAVTELLADERARSRTAQLRRSVLELPKPTTIVEHLEAALR
ncbi:glycosyltransferase [Janibacter terrae]|uniref:glycosyltransferase n=1 Tax=Janibacter terrae TaxID=103817 RepID=UPI003815907D